MPCQKRNDFADRIAGDGLSEAVRHQNVLDVSGNLNHDNGEKRGP